MIHLWEGWIYVFILHTSLNFILLINHHNFIINLSQNQTKHGKILRIVLYWFLSSQAPEVGNTCKTWDGPSGSCSNLVGSELDLESVQRSYTAPDRTGIRIYYSPPAVRRMEHQRRNPEPKEPQQAKNGSSSLRLSVSDVGLAGTESLEVQKPPSSFLSSYEQWLSSLSKQHRELLESRSGCIAGSIPSIVSNGVGGSANSLVDGMTPSPAFHGLEIGEISANLSDDMKEMTNCVRQAIRSSSLERKSTKEPGSQVVHF